MIERDPIAFSWRTAPRRHAVAAALAVLAGTPLVVLAMLCLRDLLDAPIRDTAGMHRFLALTLSLPDGDGAQPLPLSGGFVFSVADMTFAALCLLAGAALLLAGLGWGVGRICLGIRASTVQRLRNAATEAILNAPAGGREELRTLPHQVARVLAALDPLTVGGIVIPAMTAAAILAALFLASLATFRLVPAIALGLFAFGLAELLVLRRRRACGGARNRERQAAEAGLADLINRLPAIRTHGAAPFEKRRLSLRALAARGTLAALEARLAYALAPRLALMTLLPAIIVATALWHGAGDAAQTDTLDPGALVATSGAFALAATLIALSLRLWFVHQDAAPLLRNVAQSIETLLAHRATGGPRGTAFPAGGTIAAEAAAGYDAASGERVVGVDIDLPMPAHIALIGERGGGSTALAALLAGQIEPSAGRVTYGGVPLRSLDPTERAHRIAFAGSEAILIEGTLRQNLLYGARTDDREALDVAARIALVRLAGLDAFVYARGLDGHVDPQADPALATAIVAARRATREALEAQGLAHLVEPFDPDRYNHQATVGENILFGEARGPSFSQARLAGHPYLRAVLEAEDLMQVFLEMGLEIARATVEIFADLPDDHPLLASYSLFPPRERGYFEDLIARQREARGWRRGLPGQRDRERLIALTLRYSETRHRFGLVDEAVEARIIDARRSFAALLPPKFREKVEFYDPGRLTAAASLEENVLFGRIAQGEADAEPRVRALVRRVLAEQGLEPTVYRLGLASRVESDLAATGVGRRTGSGAIGTRERMAIELVRCLVRRPDILVVALPVEVREPERVRERIESLRAIRAGSGLIVCLPDAGLLDGLAPFDRVLRIERSALVPDQGIAGTGETDPLANMPQTVAT